MQPRGEQGACVEHGGEREEAETDCCDVERALLEGLTRFGDHDQEESQGDRRKRERARIADRVRGVQWIPLLEWFAQERWFGDPDVGRSVV